MAVITVTITIGGETFEAYQANVITSDAMNIGSHLIYQFIDKVEELGEPCKDLLRTEEV